ncbi:MAG: glycoside hydrolase family 2 protein [Hyphomicrobiales bacterium]|nr:MAG: glycoside hydrolase family 2 protein [Hyphomicrobiales bacterium]
MLSTPAGLISAPGELPRCATWIRAAVPGTVAGAKQDAGLWTAAAPAPLDGEDHWYRTRIFGQGRETLRFAGLATLATVWLNGREILSSRNMFLAHDVEVELAGEAELVICFRSLDKALAESSAAGRWRPRMITPSGLRNVRTSVLGHMPGWCPAIPTIGPWRPVERFGPGRTIAVDMHASLAGTTGVLDVVLQSDAARRVEIHCAGRSAPLAQADAGTFSGRLEIPGVTPWWPHTHGTPTLHQVTATIDGREIVVGRTGFRAIAVDKGSDGAGFALRVNDTAIFCRGALWSSADLGRMPSTREAYEPWLRRARDAGMNMIRVPGTTVYEADAFYDLCDELGLLVWQDFMFANFDYPAADPAFAESVKQEAAQFLSRTRASPAIAVLCGGSEVYQQAAMLGLPERKYRSPIFDAWLPEIVTALRPDVPYVPGSPSGGALPFVVDEGVGHYFGVGAYRRPLADARHASVRFASECLAFANVPPEITAPEGEPPLVDIADPRWKVRIPRDAGATWDFEDVRDHYLEELFGERVLHLRTENPERYLELSRATQAAVVEHALTEWTRSASPTRGALVLMLQDFQAGAGWGLIASCGAPKSPWYAMRRVFKPVRVTLTDEGVNGLAVHLANETADPRETVLELTAWREGRTQVLAAKQAVTLGARSSTTLSAFKLIGSFFDISYAYRFAAPQHDATVATLRDGASGEVRSQAFHFPLGHARSVPEGALSACVEEDAGGYALVLKADRLARFVHVVDPGFLPEDDWFHLAPKAERRIRLTPRDAASGRPKGKVRATNMPAPVAYEAAR